MPRKYIRKTTTKYNFNDLQKAIEDVKNKKLTLGLASIKYSVPKTTIHDQLKKEKYKHPKKGRLPVFNNEQENELAQYIIKCCKTFYGITITSLRKIAYNFATTNKLKHNFNNTTRMAGMDWYYSFISRHSDITLRTPEATSLNRITVFNETEVRIFFENLTKLQADYGFQADSNNTTRMAGMDWYYSFISRHSDITLRTPEATSFNRITAFNETEVRIFFENLTKLQADYGFQADSIYNIDETGITNVQKNSKILAPKGLKQVGKATSAERGTTTTVVCAFSAGGTYIPPMFIFKRKRMTELLIKGCNSNMIATVSDSGWINESIFIQWLYHFISHAKPSTEKPVSLILDNHESHISLESYTLYRDHGIHALSLPPHASHRMQPLDLTFFGPLKSAYNKECELYMANNPGQRITQYDVSELFTKAYNRVANIDKAANGFKAAGIFPMDPEKFDDLFVTQHDAPSTMDHSTSIQAISTADIPVTPTSSSAKVGGEPDQATPSSSTNNRVPLTEIVNLPIIQPKKPAIIRKHNKKHSEILSSSPMKTQLEAKQKKQMEKMENQLLKKKTAMTKKLAVTIKKENQPRAMKKNTGIGEKSKRIKGAKNLKSFEQCANDKGLEYFCIFCAERYVSPPTEDWIMCMTCKLWAHENCTSGESTSKGFVCDICKKK